jgi:putative spermidine/putrescine transport system substrate-binding protein
LAAFACLGLDEELADEEKLRRRDRQFVSDAIDRPTKMSALDKLTRKRLSSARMGIGTTVMRSRSALALFVTATLVVAACGDDLTDGDAAAESAPAESAPSSTEAVAAEGSTTDAPAFATAPGFDITVYGELPDQVVIQDGGGGAIERAKATRYDNFRKATGVRVVSDYYCCDLAKLNGQVESGNYTWEVTELSSAGDLLLAKRQGLLEKLDPNLIPFDQLEPGTYTEYGVPVSQFGTTIAWNTEVFGSDGPVPEGIEDIFDTTSFPGKRCMMNYPQYGGTLEAALLADGVAPEDIYPLDVERALAKLDTIKDDIVWWESGDEAVQYLVDGECDIALAYSGRVYDRAVGQGQPLALSWGHAIIDTSYEAIPKGAPNRAAAHAFIAWWITDIDGMKAFVEQVPYPAPMVGLPLEDYPPVVQPWLPLGANTDTAIPQDPEYYADNIAAVAERFAEWLAS